MKKTALSLALSLSLTLMPVSATPAIQWLPSDLTPVGTTQAESYATPTFQQGLMVVSRQVQGETRYGYIDRQGTLVIDTQFLQAKPFSADLPLAPASILVTEVIQDEAGEEVEISRPLYGYIDQTGEFVLPPTYVDAYPFSQDLAPISSDGTTWGYINPEGEEIIPQDYHWAHDFSQGYAVVQQGDHYGLIDTQGEIILPIDRDGLGAPGDILFPAQDRAQFGFINLEGKTVVPFNYSSVGYFSQELALVEKSGKWSYVDTLGNQLTPLIYDQAHHFSQGLAWVAQDGTYQYIDTSGTVVLDGLEDFTEVTSFVDGYARGKQSFLYGFLDKTGTTILPYQYKDAIPVSQGTGLVYNGTTWGTFTPTPRTNPWAETFVSQASDLEMIPYHLQGIDLTAAMDRTQFVALTIRLFDLLNQDSPQDFPALAQNPFQDTRDLSVRRAQQLGITTGLSQNVFGAYHTLTREQAATMLTVLYTHLTQEELGEPQSPPFADHDDISPWAQDSVYFLAEKGILTGIGNNLFDPSASISAESALVMTLAMNNLLA